MFSYPSLWTKVADCNFKLVAVLKIVLNSDFSEMRIEFGCDLFEVFVVFHTE